MRRWFRNAVHAPLGAAACTALALGLGAVATPAAAQVVVIENGDSTRADSGRAVEIKDSDGRRYVISVDGPNSGSGIVRFGDNIEVKAGQRVLGDVVAIGGSIRTAGEIYGSCVAIGGTVHVLDGSEIRGEVVSIGGTLTLEPDVTIWSDAVSVWGRMEKAEGATVRGDVVEVGGFGPLAWNGGWGANVDGWFTYGSFARRIMWVAILMGLGALLFHVFPGQMTYLTQTMQESGLKAFLWGLLFWILWLPIVIALCITVIGIIAALGLIFLTPLLMLLGYLAAAKALGLRFTGGRLQALRPFLIGLLILEGGVLLGRAFGFSGALGFVSIIVSSVAWTALFIAVTTGVGAVLITRFRSGPKVEAPPAPPEPAQSPAPTPPPASAP